MKYIKPSDYGRIDLIVFPIWRENWSVFAEIFAGKPRTPLDLDTWNSNKQQKAQQKMDKEKQEDYRLLQETLREKGYVAEKECKWVGMFGRADFYHQDKNIVVELKYDIYKNIHKNIAQLAFYVVALNAEYGILIDIQENQIIIDKRTAINVASYFLLRSKKIIANVKKMSKEQYLSLFALLVQEYEYTRYQSLLLPLAQQENLDLNDPLVQETLKLSLEPLERIFVDENNHVVFKLQKTI